MLQRLMLASWLLIYSAHGLSGRFIEDCLDCGYGGYSGGSSNFLGWLLIAGIVFWILADAKTALTVIGIILSPIVFIWGVVELFPVKIALSLILFAFCLVWWKVFFSNEDTKDVVAKDKKSDLKPSKVEVDLIYQKSKYSIRLLNQSTGHIIEENKDNVSSIRNLRAFRRYQALKKLKREDPDVLNDSNDEEKLEILDNVAYSMVFDILVSKGVIIPRSAKEVAKELKNKRLFKKPTWKTKAAIEGAKKHGDKVFKK